MNKKNDTLEVLEDKLCKYQDRLELYRHRYTVRAEYENMFLETMRELRGISKERSERYVKWFVKYKGW